MTTVGSQTRRAYDTGRVERPRLFRVLRRSGYAVVLSYRGLSEAVDIDTQHNLPDFIMNRGGVSCAQGRHHS